MMKKWMAAMAALMLLCTAVGCAEKEESSADSATETTVATTTEPVVTTTWNAEPQVEELDMPAVFGDLSFQVADTWGTLAAGDIAIWYATDGSGALSVQKFDPVVMELDTSDPKAVLVSISENLAAGNTVVSEVWNTLQDTDAYAVTYTPAAEEEVDTAGKMNVSILFHVGEAVYAMTFSNYNGNSPMLKNMDAVMKTVQF